MVSYPRVLPRVMEFSYRKYGFHNLFRRCGCRALCFLQFDLLLEVVVRLLEVAGRKKSDLKRLEISSNSLRKANF